MTSPIDWLALLHEILGEFSCQTGTVHRIALDGSEHLTLVVQIGVPERLLEKISHIPFGKGIAGVAAATKQPVELCNLQQDLGPAAMPDARQTGVAGALAVAIFSPCGEQVIGTLGIGKYVPYGFTEEEKIHLAAHAKRLAGYFIHETLH